MQPLWWKELIAGHCGIIGSLLQLLMFLRNKEWFEFQWHCILVWEKFANAVTCVFNNRELLPPWVILQNSEKYLVHLRVFSISCFLLSKWGSNQKSHFFTNTSLCRLFLVPLFVVLPVLQDFCAKIKWCCFSVVLYRDLCHLPFLVVRSWCGRTHLGFVF